MKNATSQARENRSQTRWDTQSRLAEQPHETPEPDHRATAAAINPHISPVSSEDTMNSVAEALESLASLAGASIGGESVATCDVLIPLLGPLSRALQWEAKNLRSIHDAAGVRPEPGRGAAWNRGSRDLDALLPVAG